MFADACASVRGKIIPDELPERGSKRRSALINVTLIGACAVAWAEARAENIAPITRAHPIFSAVRLREELFIS